jgi:hypothetical protein
MEIRHPLMIYITFFQNMQDKNLLTKKRTHWANYYFGNHDITTLEEKYGKYLYVPLDIPIISPNDHEKFVSYYFKNAKPSVKVKADVSGAASGNSAFISIDGVPTSDRSIWSKNYIPSFRSEFKELFDQIIEYFPIKSLDNFIIWNSIANISSHRDESIMLDLPVHFRIMLHNPNDTSTLHITHQNITQEIDIPISTNSFAWNNLRTTHGSTLQKPKILFLFGDPLQIDWTKYDHLIEKSISTYKEYVIEDKTTSIKDFIHSL